MPPKRKKSVRQKQKQRQSQSQKVIVNVGKTTPRKRKTSGRGRLPPPSYQQNLFPPTIIQQQAPNIAVLENKISSLTSMIQQPIGIKQPETPLSADTGAKNAEAQRLAGEQAEARRPGPTAENFQSQPSLSRQEAGITGVDAFGFPLDIPQRVSPEPFRQTQQQIISGIVQKAETDRKAREFPTLKQLAVRGLTRQFSTEQLNRVRPPDPQFNQTLVNPADPPKMVGLGEGGGDVPLAESRRAGPGAPRKGTQVAVSADGTPIAKPTKRPKASKKETQSKTILDFTKRTEQAGGSL